MGKGRIIKHQQSDCVTREKGRNIEYARKSLLTDRTIEKLIK